MTVGELIIALGNYPPEMTVAPATEGQLNGGMFRLRPFDFIELEAWEPKDPHYTPGQYTEYPSENDKVTVSPTTILVLYR